MALAMRGSNELKVRTVYDTYFVAVDKRSKQSYICKYKDINKTIYIERTDALDYIKTEERNRTNEKYRL